MDETFTHPVTGNPVQVSSGWQRTRSHFTVTWHYDHLLPDGEVERLTVQSRHDLIPSGGLPGRAAPGRAADPGIVRRV